VHHLFLVHQWLAVVKNAQKKAAQQKHLPRKKQKNVNQAANAANAQIRKTANAAQRLKKI
jgi:hypothetical protein